jgi:hypothetical protein
LFLFLAQFAQTPIDFGDASFGFLQRIGRLAAVLGGLFQLFLEALDLVLDGLQLVLPVIQGRRRRQAEKQQ